MKATATQKEEPKRDGANRRRPPAPPLGNQRALGNDGGRPTLYRPEYVDQVRKLCQLGATDIEVARFLEINPATLYRWQAEHPEFCEAMAIGKAPADNRVERSLYQRACGYDIPIRKVVIRKEGDAEIVTVTETVEHIPGDVGAIGRWLSNRKPRQWCERLDVEVQPQRSLDEIKAGIVKKLIDWGIKIVPPDPPLIEGKAKEAETVGVARRKGP
jgi:hypothetical protein